MVVETGNSHETLECIDTSAFSAPDLSVLGEGVCFVLVLFVMVLDTGRSSFRPELTGATARRALHACLYLTGY